MLDSRPRTKSELKLLFSNLKRKGITDDMMSILIDVLWRERFTMRTAGFAIAGGGDSEIGWDLATRSFTIAPRGYEASGSGSGSGFVPRFTFYSWSYRAVFHIKYEPESITIPEEEGLFVVYYAAHEITRTQELHFIKNPSNDALRNLYLNQVVVASLYWDDTNKELIYFGDDRFGSEWNSQMRWYLHTSANSVIRSGLQVSGMEINEDGSADSHAKFSILPGEMWHDDILMDRPGGGGASTIPVLYFSGDSHTPRYASTSGFQVLKGVSRISFNSGGTQLLDVASGNFVLYHAFAVNDTISGKEVISVAGQNEYVKLAEALAGVKQEVYAIRGLMPQQGRCYLGSVVFRADDSYTNFVKARVVGYSGEDELHPPVTIDEDSLEFLEIDSKQELRFKDYKEVVQSAHGFIVGTPIRRNGVTWVGAMANNAENANTMGIVSEVIDANTFRYKTEGFLPGAWLDGKEYFLSPLASQIIVLPDPEVWNIGEVRQHIGYGTPQGLKIEIDVGDEIGTLPAYSGGGLLIAVDDVRPTGPETVWWQPTTGTLSILIDAQWVAVSKVGVDGISAYESWLNVGNVGTEQDFINSLTGKSAFEIWLLVGNVGTEADFILSLKGDTGYSAYEIWLNLGNTGTEQDFINYLMTGQSAYDIWISQGNVGTEADFLLSLKGVKGDKGNTGDSGSNAYVYIAYASDANGTGFTMTFNSSLNYIAFLSTQVYYSNPTASLFAGKWKNLNSSLWKENGSTLEPVDSLKTVTAVNFVLSSERKLKERINPISDLKKFDSIEFREYVLKSDKEQRLRFGVIVDEIEPIAPELIYTSPNGSKTVAYIDLLIAKIARLEEEIAKLKTKI